MRLLQNTLLSLIFLFVSCFSFVGIAQGEEAAFKWSNQEGKAVIGNEFGAQDAQGASNLTATVAKVIGGALGFLGIIFVILLILAGFKYMLASGDDQTKEALTQIKNSVVGLIIVISAYAIAEFVIKAVSE